MCHTSCRLWLCLLDLDWGLLFPDQLLFYYVQHVLHSNPEKTPLFLIMLIIWIMQNYICCAHDTCDRDSFTSHARLGKGWTSPCGLKLLYQLVPKEVPYAQSRMRTCLSTLSVCCLSSNKYCSSPVLHQIQAFLQV